MVRRCYLKCVLNSHAPIELPHNVVIVVGRSKTTKIKNQACSRRQLSLKADCENCQVEVKHLGPNPSGLDGFAMNKNGTYTLSHGSRIEILLNNYVHKITFCPPQSEAECFNKRKIEEGEDFKHNSKSLKTIHYDGEDSPFLQNTDTWEEIDKGELYIFTSKNVKPSNKIAAFDMDGTLIKTKSGKVYPVDTNDWQLAFPNVGKKLNELIMEGFKVVILSNQAPIGNGRVKIEDFKKKIESLVTKLNIPVQVFIATGKGFYRKPAIGMWKYLSDQKNGDVEIDIPDSFYCGDAAGRLANWAPGKKKDHSMADKLLAENLDLKFYTPEEYFLGHSMARVPVAKPEFIPKEVKSENFHEHLIADEKEILVLVGYPGSGKSFLAKQIEEKSNHKYATVCRDILGSWQKCASEATKILKSGKSVIVDSTNPDVVSRGRWITLAKELHVSCRCAKMMTSKAHSQHNNKYRELMKINHMVVNDIVFHTYKNKYFEPTVGEGFKEVLSVNFNPSFDNEESEKLYKMYLLEKV